MFDEYKDVLTVEDVHNALSMGKTKIYQLLKSKTIKSIKVGRIYYIPKIYLIDFINQYRYN